jgi:hypothetical protein
MLRGLVALLVLANALTWSYHQGHLQAVGLSPATVREPERLTAQVNPDKLEWRLFGAESPAPANPPPVDTSTACWQVGGYTASQADALKQALAEPGVPTGWALEDNLLPARWVVYLGKFASTEALQRRKTELRQAKVDFRDVSNPALQPGLALGTYSTEEAAQQALQDVQKAGVRGAKVAQERPDTHTYTVKWPALTPTERAQLNPLGPAFAGKSLQECP